MQDDLIEREPIEDYLRRKAKWVEPEFDIVEQHRLLEAAARIEALCRAIEQHEAFRQEVSDAVEWVVNSTYMPAPSEHKLRHFIIAKPDPLVEAAQEVAAAEAKKFGLELKDYAVEQEWADSLRAAIEKRGGKIVWREG